MIEDAQLSDHFLVYFNLGILGRRNIPGSNIVNKQPRSYKYRDYSSLACDDFRNSVSLYCDQLFFSEENAEVLADSLFKKLSDDLDQFAPSVSGKQKRKCALISSIQERCWMLRGLGEVIKGNIETWS